MDKLTKTLEKFAYTFNKSGENIGYIKFTEASQCIDDQLSFFYKTLRFEQNIYLTGAMLMEIISIENLEKAQEGWFFIRDENSNLIEDHKRWDREWVVFATRHGDAIFYNKKDGSIQATIDKKIFFKLSHSLEEFIKIITSCLILEAKYGFETTDDDEEILEEFITDVKKILKKDLAQELHVEFLGFFFE